MVWIRGRVNSVRAKGNSCFVVIRSGSFYTVQGLHFKDKENVDISKSMIKFIGNIQLESIVDIYGVVANANVKSCSQDNVELQIRKMFVLSRAPTVLPFCTRTPADRRMKLMPLNHKRDLSLVSRKMLG